MSERAHYTIRTCFIALCATAVILAAVGWGIKTTHRDQDQRTQVKLACIQGGGTPVDSMGCVRR